MPEKDYGQTALEYIMIIGGAIMFVVIVVVIIRSGIIAGQTERVNQDVCAFEKKYLRPDIMMFDNFDAGTASNWVPSSGDWAVINGAYTGGPSDTIEDKTFSKTPFSNFTFVMKFRLKKGANAAGNIGGVYLRHIDSSKYYGLFFINSNTPNRIFFSDFNAVNIDSPITGTFSDWQVLKVKAYGNKFDVYQEINCKDFLLGSWTDTSDVFYTGKFGLFVGSTPPKDDILEVEDFIVYRE